MAGRKTFTAGEVLQAADVNDFLMDQSVMVFAGTAARGSAIPSPTEGMASYRTDDDSFEIYDGSAWSAVAGGKILQVVYAEKTDTQTLTSLGAGATAAITGLTASITPSSVSSKILISYDVNGAGDLNAAGYGLILKRDSTAISIGDASGSRTRLTSGGADRAQNSGPSNAAATVLDSPATTSSVSYSFEILNTENGTVTFFINRSQVTADAAYNGHSASRITLMEVAG